MLQQFRILILFVFMATIIVACDSSSSTPAPPTNTAIPTDTATPIPTNTPRPTVTPVLIPQSFANDPSDQVYLRLVNAGIDLPPLTVNIEGLLIASGLEFGVASFPTGITAGNYNMIISSPDSILREESIELNGGDNLILMFTGTEEVFNVSIFDEAIAPLRAEQSRVNLIHAIPRGPNLTIKESGIDIIEPIDFGQISDPAIVDSGPITLQFQAGDDEIITLPTTLREHVNYTYILLGDFNNRDSLSIISFDNRVPGFTNLRLVNASNDIGSVDIYFDDIQVASGLTPTRFTERQDIPSQSYQLTVYAQGNDTETTTPIIEQEYIAQENDILTLILTGTQENAQIIVMQDDLTLTSLEETRIRFLNAVPEYPSVDMAIVGAEEIPDLSQLSYNQPSRVYEIPAGSYGFQWSEIQNGEIGTILESANELILEAGRNYLYIFTGQDDDTPFILSENVGTSTEVVDFDEDTTQTSQAVGPTQMRFVNAIDSAPLINVFFDDLEIGTLLAGRQTLDFSIIPSGLHIVSIRDETNTEILAGIEVDFQPDTNYSFFAYGYAEYRYDIAVIEDRPILSEDDSIVRLVHLSQGDNSTFALHSIESSANNFDNNSLAEATEEVTTSRPSLFSGTLSLTPNIAEASASRFVTIRTGLTDFIIVDQLTRVASIFPDINIEANNIYEVIVYEDTFSNEARGFVLQYLAP